MIFTHSQVFSLRVKWQHVPTCPLYNTIFRRLRTGCWWNIFVFCLLKSFYFMWRDLRSIFWQYILHIKHAGEATITLFLTLQSVAHPLLPSPLPPGAHQKKQKCVCVCVCVCVDSGSVLKPPECEASVSYNVSRWQIGLLVLLPGRSRFHRSRHQNTG